MKRIAAILLIIIVIFLAACRRSQNDDEIWQINTVVHSYPDGTYIYYYGGDEYEHVFPGGCTVDFGGFLAESLATTKTQFPFSIADQNCTIESYAFAPTGQVAFHAYLLQGPKSTPERYVWINTNNTRVYGEVFSVLDLNEQTETQFPDYTALYRYCEKRGIALGCRYICGPFKSDPEEIQPLAGDYCLVKYPYDLAAIRKGQENIYFGKISELEVSETGISFHLTVPRTRYFPPASVQQNADLPLKDADGFSFFQILFNLDNLFDGDINIQL